MLQIQLLSQVSCFSGQQNQYQHYSASLGCRMQFSVYLPPQAIAGEKVPTLYWLSGLTCNDQNFATKAGAQRVAAELGVAIVMPDTSPRGKDVPVDAENAYDFGLGAGFYLNATQAPWAQYYQMYSYIVDELPAVLGAQLPLSGLRSIAGHSMGGHGALTIALKNPEKYRSASAFSPIVHPIQSPWGVKAFGRYLGSDEQTWKAYDTVELIRQGALPLPVLVDQGTADQFLKEQLHTDLLERVCAETGYKVQIRYQEGYDHSYYFVATFIEEHLRFHARYLQNT